MTDTTIKKQIESLIKSAPVWSPHANNATARGSQKGSRNQTLFDIAIRNRQQGHDEASIFNKISSINRRRFTEPLPESEVRQIARGVMRYEPPGLTELYPTTAEVPGRIYPRTLAHPGH